MRQLVTMYETRGGFITLPSSSVVDFATVAGGDQYVFDALPAPPANVVKTRIGLTANLGTDFYAPGSLAQSPPVSGDWTVPYSTGRSGFSGTHQPAPGALA